MSLKCTCYLFLLLNVKNFNSQVSASNILFFHTVATASHRTSIWPLVEELADAGHNITYIFPISRRIGTHPRIEELKPSKMCAIADTFVGNFDINIRLNNTQNEWLQEAFLKGVEFCEAFYDSPETKEWLAKPNLHFDLVMMDAALGQCAYGLVYKFKAKHIIFSPVAFPFLWEPYGVEPESSTVPEFMFHQKPNDLLSGSLKSRTINTLASVIWRHSFLGSLRSVEALARENLELKGMPSFEEIERETSLVLHNTNFIEDYPMALPPMFVSYSGLLCSKRENRNRKLLPKDLEQFISDNENDGFVYVSFGSSVVVSAMPDDLRKQFMTAFAAFPKLRFLWKWTGTPPVDAPKNIWFQAWFAQKDILSHPRIKAFIMQAGRPSTQEALCFGVPMITVPIFADQDLNADRLEHIGAAILLDIASVTSQTLIDAIGEIVKENNKYKQKMMELSAMFKDRPMDPVDNAFYWVEYVLKHNTSLPLKSLKMSQNWWQRNLLDIYAFVSAISTIILMSFTVLIVYVIKFLARLIRKNYK